MDGDFRADIQFSVPCAVPIKENDELIHRITSLHYVNKLPQVHLPIHLDDDLRLLKALIPELYQNLLPYDQLLDKQKEQCDASHPTRVVQDLIGVGIVVEVQEPAGLVIDHGRDILLQLLQDDDSDDVIALRWEIVIIVVVNVHCEAIGPVRGFRD